ncbi:MAG: transcriptional repressor [Ferruginibacter sp.]|nr:transcriptional repressor [Ferruginibacter sp.]
MTNDAVDRFTIYRTLDLFVCKGIIHIIPSMDSVTRYALLQSKKEAGSYKNHLHFMCDNCGKTICLNTIPVPMMPLPKGYSIKDTEVIVKGTCKNCN